MSEKNKNKEAIWSQFDEQWYQKFYPEIVSLVNVIYGGSFYLFYKERGCKLGHSPNIFFDEEWYLRTYPEIADAVRQNKFSSGFDHYRSQGYETYSPHWLFSEQNYRKKYSYRVDEIELYVNAYDHYLQKGVYAFFSENFFFNPILYLSQQNDPLARCKENYFAYCLSSLPEANRFTRLSWFFDEEWYLDTYPEVKILIATKKVRSGLHHYLFNETPLLFSPNKFFSEEFYMSEYPDVASYIQGSKELRNGYAHYLSYGLQEGRLPHKGFDLQQLSQGSNPKNPHHDGLYANDFEYWLARQYSELAENYEQSYEKLFKVVEVVQEHNVASSIPSKKNTGALTPWVDQNVEKKPKQSNNAVMCALENETNTIESLDSSNVNNDSDISSTITISEPSTEPESNTKAMNLLVGNESVAVNDSPSALFTSRTNLSWKYFDEEWYINRYQDVTSQMKALELDSVEEYYRSIGSYKGHSPNPFFDEEWYLQTYPEVKCLVDNRSIRSGFEHYCQKGYQTFSPHWLFSEALYKRQNPALDDPGLQQMGFLNGYDHYLKVGDAIGLNGSFYFDSDYFTRHYYTPIRPGFGPYAYYLKFLLGEKNELQGLSWYFDPQWYLKQYPQVENFIEQKKFINPVHHYLTNDTPKKYSPLYWFDEEFYLAKYFDENSLPAMSKIYRTGYNHFLSEGILKLHKPKDNVDLKSYSERPEVRESIQKGLCPNVFLHWLSNHADTNEKFTEAEELKNTTNEEKITNKENNTASSSFISPQVMNALWFAFDEEWYQRKYPTVLTEMKARSCKSLQEYYENVGCLQGCSPNAFFDEAWYLRRYPSVQNMIEKGKFKTGFEHYCRIGFKINDPHWLFSSSHYLRFNSQIIWEVDNSTQFANVYDYFLKIDDQNRKTGSLYFDPVVYEQSCFTKGEKIDNNCPFQSYLQNQLICNKQTDISLYFDTEWYLEHYPEVKQQIEGNDFSCALEHYLSNITPIQYNPSQWFSEEFYLERYADVKNCIVEGGSGVFRNGYHHFLKHGVFELRQPSNELDLKAYYDKSNLKDKLYSNKFRDAYAYWVYTNRVNEWLERHRQHAHYHPSDEIQLARAHFRKKTQNSLIQNLRHKINFAYEGEPEISVVMVAHNQLTLTLFALHSLRSNFTGKIQLLLGDNHSIDGTQHCEAFLVGAEVVHFPYNYGFGRACNELISNVKAPITVFLNNDIRLYPDALPILCNHLVSDPSIGAVGGKIIHTDGLLQEAGSLIWRDGSTLGYLRGKDPNVPEANFIREVDYCSAAMLAIKTPLLTQLKGFSPNYFPAYFEDVDLCVRIIKAGYKIIYHPDAMVEHLEYASSNPIVSDGLTLRHRHQFIKDHIEFLKYQYPYHADNISFARQRLGKTKKILFIEDRIPIGRLGSGFVRSYDIILKMVELGYFVTIFPINFHSNSLEFYQNYPATIEILYDRTIEDMGAFFHERAGFYDVIWIGRTHNLARMFPMIEKANRFLPLNRIILDTEAVAAPRTHQRAEVLKIDLDESFDKTLEIELTYARYCQTIIAVNPLDAHYIEKLGFNDVQVLGHCMETRCPSKSWQERQNILFVGALHDELSPNFDSLTWFIKEVFPLLMDHFKGDIELTVAGYVHPSVNLLKLALYPQIKFLGSIENLEPLFNTHKVFVAPTRFAGGIPYKVQEAASYGLPIVASEILVQQLEWKDEDDILSAPISTPDFFASQIVKLYQDETLWNKIQHNALLRIKNDCNTLQFREKLRTILNNVISSDVL
ncbi:hypothetical protein COMNV_00330 [Commensalibacter sp. Nvir]|uniref:glycosyltransferase n=1 Tax=Commensalibacter sp. Nvir TaxID=3069817 RepID=UPI002D2C5BF3|nr:hypothetical protein COMNV_00330 [Commensalibacter sp. Nvir]